jgi:hypothetical protein
MSSITHVKYPCHRLSCKHRNASKKQILVFYLELSWIVCVELIIEFSAASVIHSQGDWDERTCSTHENRTENRILVGQPEGRPKHRWQYNIKLIFRKLDVDWMAQGSVQWWTFVIAFEFYNRKFLNQLNNYQHFQEDLHHEILLSRAEHQIRLSSIPTDVCCYEGRQKVN